MRWTIFVSFCKNFVKTSKNLLFLFFMIFFLYMFLEILLIFRSRILPWKKWYVITIFKRTNLFWIHVCFSKFEGFNLQNWYLKHLCLPKVVRQILMSMLSSCLSIVQLIFLLWNWFLICLEYVANNIVQFYPLMLSFRKLRSLSIYHLHVKLESNE